MSKKSGAGGWILAGLGSLGWLADRQRLQSRIEEQQAQLADLVRAGRERDLRHASELRQFGLELNGVRQALALKTEDEKEVRRELIEARAALSTSGRLAATLAEKVGKLESPPSKTSPPEGTKTSPKV